MDIKPYLVAWVQYHENLAYLFASLSDKYARVSEYSQEYMQISQEHADLADYYINMLGEDHGF